MNELTICTVSYGHKELIEKNIELSEKYNPGVNFSWIITENTPPEDTNRFEVGKRKNISVLSGGQAIESDIARGSYHHGEGLNRAVKEAGTRFVLILDPDFFIIRKNWVSDVLLYMKGADLAFLGASYNPKRYLKYRYFPCVHCMFIDLEKIPKEELDFMPRYKRDLKIGREDKDNSISISRKFSKIVTIRNHARLILKRSAVIGSSRDTGYNLYEKYAKNPSTKSECFMPVFKISSANIRPRYIGGTLNFIFEKILPDRLCYIPKRDGYFSKIGFKEMGASDLYGIGWDEFLWQGKPFGFHMQGAKRDGTIKKHEGAISFLNTLIPQ